MNPETLRAARAAAALALLHPGAFRVVLPLEGDVARGARAVLRSVGGVVVNRPGEHVITEAEGGPWVVRQSPGGVLLSTPVLAGAEGLARLGLVARALRGEGVRADVRRSMGVWLDAIGTSITAVERVRRLVLRHGPLLTHAHGVRWPEESRALNKRELRQLANSGAARRSAEEWLSVIGDTTPGVGLDIEYLVSHGVLGFAFGPPGLHSASVVAHVQIAVGLLHRAVVGRAVVGRAKPFTTATARHELRLLLLYLGFIGAPFRAQREQMLSR